MSMEGKKEITKELLAESFHNLLLKHDFDKITIKMIADEAGVIRPTFYYYFQDKHDVLSWYLYKNVFSRVREFSKLDMDLEGVRSIFIALKQDAAFYRKAFLVAGQNAFEQMFYDYCYELFLERVQYYTLKRLPDNPLLKPAIIANYYTIGFVSIVKEWLLHPEDKREYSIEDIFNAYQFLISHSIFDVLDAD